MIYQNIPRHTQANLNILCYPLYTVLYHDILFDLLITNSNLHLLRTIYSTLGHSAVCSDPSGLARGVCSHYLSPSITFLAY